MAAPTPPRATPASPASGYRAASRASRRCTVTTRCASRACRRSCAIATLAAALALARCGAASTASGRRPTSARKPLDGPDQARRVEPLLHHLLERAAVAPQVRAGTGVARMKATFQQPAAVAQPQAAVHVLALRHQHKATLADP